MYLDAKYAIRNDLHMIHSAHKAKATPDRVFLVFEERKYTYRQLEVASNRLSHWLLDQNVQKGDIICMMHQNHPTFLIAFWAISKIGAIPSLINYNLSGDALLHCLTVAKSKIFLFDPLFEDQVATVAQEAQDGGVQLTAYGEATEFQETPCQLVPALVPSVLRQYSAEDPSEQLLKGIDKKDVCFLIYTSGIIWGAAMLSRLSKNDVTYCCLPLYHATGCGTFVLARKFSATRFWDDVYNNNVTVCYYVGELCRYLMNQPHHPLENKHQVRLFFGNGMAPDIWSAFRERFHIKEVDEFYGASEGPNGVFNINKNERTAGAVGYLGPLLHLFRQDLKLVKVDPVTEDPCDYMEPGEMLLGITTQGGRSEFHGYYKNKQATDKKLIHDVFQKGDVYFRTGDLLKRNKEGMYYFVDRLGDTFRWKSENVATTEVTQAICKYPAIAEANVFGVTVPHMSGRAGMAALILRQGVQLDFDDFYNHLSSQLPKYAIPVFLRFVPSMNMTGNFKQQKVAFRNEGIDKIPEDQAVYWLQNGKYVPFTKRDLARVQEGNVKF
ncbi:acetyl-CoA synthetase-like protein [Lichtheimia hyalospora FSU 10163]|nr:acetyl-CoA synthetase-like protein [Lichtheimia hyalospora FSU 10163]